MASSQPSKKRLSLTSPAKMNSFFKTVAIYTLIGLAILLFISSLSPSTPDSKEVAISQMISDLKDQKVGKLSIEGDKIIIDYKNGENRITHKEAGESIYKIIESAGVDPKLSTIEIKDLTWQQMWISIASTLLPILVMVVLFFFLFRNAREGAQGIFAFGQSRAKIFNKDAPQVKFTDVAGVDEAKRELSEIVDFLKNPDKYTALGARIPKGVLLIGPAGVGKCIRGDSLVWTNKGLLEIQDIPKYFAVEESGYVHGATVSSFIPENASSQNSSASHWYDLGISQTFKLTTNMGHEIEGTPEHPIVAIDPDGQLKFKRIDQIRDGDWLPIKTNDQMFGTYSRINKEQAYMLGLLTGDGGLTIKDRIYFSTADQQLLTAFTSYFKDNHAYEVKKTSSKYDVVVTSSKVKSQLMQLGLGEVYARHKKIPEYIMMAPKAQIVAFLQGIFDTDGSAYKTGKVEFASSSERLARQVSAILLNLGIIHKFRIKGSNQYSDSYQILISGQGLVVFAEQVGFRLKRKQKRLNAYLSRINTRTNIDLIPLQGKRIHRVWRYLVEANKKPSLAVSQSFHKDILRYANGIRKPSLVSLKLFINACQELDPSVTLNKDFQYLKALAYGGLFFDQVKFITESEARVYDFTVPGSHSFIANGFISHNTLLARAVAGEANVPFFSIAGSEFMEMLVGVGAARVRDMFGTAKKNSPSIIFIDEVESIGRMRGMGISGGHDEREQTLNQILVEMDGFTPSDRVIVMAATNRPDLLDPALVRPGRFDRRVMLSLPDLEERKALITLHMKGKPFTKDVDIQKIARRTVGFSGADLANMLNEAAILAARDGKTAIDVKDLEEAATKEKMGPARKRMQSETDRKLAAYHEAGHALVGHFQTGVDPVHRISIISRGASGGHTMFPPTEDRSNETKSRLIQQIATALGGQVAEEVFFKDISTGATSDIESATAIAKAMVTQYGMSDLGPINITSNQARAYEESSSISPALHDAVDKQIKKLIDAGQQTAFELVRKHKSKLEAVAKALLEKETLESDEFEKIVGTKKTA